MHNRKNPTQKTCWSTLCSVLSKPKDLIIWYLLASAALLGKASAIKPIEADSTVYFRIGGDRSFFAKPSDAVAPFDSNCKIIVQGSELRSEYKDGFPVHQVCNLETRPVREELQKDQFTGDFFRDRTLTRFLHKQGETVVSDLDFSRGDDVVVEHRQVFKY